MAKAKNYKVKEGAGELIVPKSLGEIKDVNGEFAGYKHVSKTYFEGEVISRDDVSPAIVEALKNGDEWISSRLEEVSDDASLNISARAGLPFEGYDDLSEEEVVTALRSLPGAAVAAIKAYEAERENRPEIVEYNAGLFEAPSDRVRGLVGGEYQEATPTRAGDVVTREVDVEAGTVVVGENDIGQGGYEISGDEIAVDYEEEAVPSGE